MIEYVEDIGNLISVNFENKKVKGKIQINKVGEEVIVEDNFYHYEQINLPNVEFELYSDEDIYEDGRLKYAKDKMIGTLVTDSNGTASMDQLTLGKYYLKEVKSSENNLIDNNIYHFEIKYLDQYTSEVIVELNFKNHLAKGKLEFTKTDLVNGKPIPNTWIEIYSDNSEESKIVFSGYTNDEGKICLNDLFIGKGHIIEKESADGYQITDEIVYFEIREDGEIVKVSMTNELIKVPNTSTNSEIIVISISLCLSLIGMGVILYEKIKKK